MSDFLENKCTLRVIDSTLTDFCKFFDCDNEDLNDFFHNEAVLYHNQLLGKTYFFTLNEDPAIIVCAFTISNDSIKLPLLNRAASRRLNKAIPHSKHRNNYPALLIGRLGVNKDFAGKRIGSELLDFIKAWFIHRNNKTGCRFIIVDAYNTERVLKYYEKNRFKFIFTNEEDEKESQHSSEPLSTRLLYFDLIELRA